MNVLIYNTPPTLKTVHLAVHRATRGCGHPTVSTVPFGFRLDTVHVELEVAPPVIDPRLYPRGWMDRYE